MSTQNTQDPAIVNVSEEDNSAMQDHVMAHFAAISHETGASGPSVLMAVHQVVSNAMRNLDAGAAAGIMSDSAALARGDITIEEADEQIKIHFKKLVEGFLAEREKIETEMRQSDLVSEAEQKTKH